MGALAAVWEGVEPDMAEEVRRSKPCERDREDADLRVEEDRVAEGLSSVI
jgi:hypothetical protein